MLRGVAINTVEDSAARPFPDLQGISAAGAITSRHVIASDEALELWVHDLRAGAELRWQPRLHDHLVYVWKGALTVDGTPVCAGQVVVVERLASCSFKAAAPGVTLAHFHQSLTQAPISEKAGDQVHIVAAEGQFSRWDDARAARHTVWVDAHCPNNELWLHKSAFQKRRPQSEPHLHNENEIIFVIEGGTIVGKNHGPGTAIAVAAGTVYTFGVADGGTTFINFRATNPLVKMVDRGKPVGDWMSERAFMKNELAVPVIDERAAPKP